MKWMVILSAIAFLALPLSGPAGQDTVKVGDPLDIYLRRSPEQNLTFLNLYKAFNASAEDKNEYIIVLDPKGSGSDKVVSYLPTSERDNSLKYAPNSSVAGRYNFSVLGRSVEGSPDARYRIKVTVELDYRRAGDFRTDKEFSFVIEGASDSKFHYRTGDIGASSEDLKGMDASSGGRIRVTISRDDNEMNAVTLYTGYRMRNCQLTLPMSRVDASDSTSDGTGLWIVLALAAIVAAAIIGYLAMDRWFSKDKAHGKAPAAKRGRGKGRRR